MPIGYVSLFILGVVVWIVMIAMAWRMAPGHHRNPVNWAILTFFFGPIALAALVIMGPGQWHGHAPGHEKPADPLAKNAEVAHSEHHGSGHQGSHHHGSEGKH